MAFSQQQHDILTTVIGCVMYIWDKICNTTRHKFPSPRNGAQDPRMKDFPCEEVMVDR